MWWEIEDHKYKDPRKILRSHRRIDQNRNLPLKKRSHQSGAKRLLNERDRDRDRGNENTEGEIIGYEHIWKIKQETERDNNKK